ncbi:MAG: M1 family metallopeptidase, partial [Acidimicrobiales bacterium]
MTEPSPDTDHRLPRTVSPRHYRLTINPDLDALTFAGHERVEVEVHEPVTEMVLNAADLAVDRARLSPPASGAPSSPVEAAVALDPEAERLTVTFPEAVQPGRWLLDLAFSGTINDKLAGFYRSTFSDEGGKSRTIATTQFEATDARRAFPCWDEPDRKAVFSVTLEVPPGLAAYSNTAAAGEEDLGNGRRRVRFADTMPMSTYLVAYLVGPFEATGAVDVDGVPLRVVHVPGKAHLTA